MIPKLLKVRLPFLQLLLVSILFFTATNGEAKCRAFAGTLGENTLCQDNNQTIISASPNGDVYIPNGFLSLFVLTSGDDLVIEQVSPQPAFEVDPMGRYTIHTLVFDPTTLDLGIVVPGQTTGFDVNGLLIQGGGDICASLDVAGAKFNFNNCVTLCGTFELKPGITSTTLDVANFSNGLYLIQMKIGEEVYLQQFTKTSR